ncbi:MAG TPA: sigma-70 family RNA polymerase sigma factor [Gemmataceae bacterium]
MAGAPASLLRHVHQLIANHTIGQLTDQQLLERFAAQRDEAAFALLVRRHGPMVLGLCHRLLGHEQDAEDAFQAVFLILARKAGSIRQTDVGGFLYRVAYHLAVRARGEAVKRKQRDKQVGAASRAAPGSARLAEPTDPTTDVTWREVRTVVDEELQRLPDDLRSALVLCYLEGKTHEEAARLLNWSKRTLGRRLERGRELLRSRLLTRGLTPMAALTASLFAEGGVSAAVPATLAAATLRTVLASKAAPAIAALAEAGLSILSVSKAKAALILLAASLLGGAGLWAYLEGAAPKAAAPAEPPAAKASDKPKTASPKRDATKTVEIQGRVLGPDGKPKAGAKLLLLGEDKIVELGVSAADGRFIVAIPKERRQQFLVAQADGLGIDFLNLDARKLGKTVELHLVKDHVIRGRVVNTEGKPVAGVRVAANRLSVWADNSLDSFLVFWKNRPFYVGLQGGVENIWSGTGALLATTTGADGRFALHGVGAERIVSLHLSGGGIAADEVWVANRAGFDPKPYNQATLDNLPKEKKGSYPRWMLSGPDVSVVAASEKIIRGVVAAADTRKKRPGVLVKLTRKNGDDHTGGENVALTLQAKTDAEGRYEIHGAHKAKSYLIEVRSDPASGYLGRSVWAEDTPGFRPITADIRVRKGVIVTGKMIDKTTGKPIEGFVEIGGLFDNPFVKEYSDDSFLTRFNWTTAVYRTDANGVFRAVTLPGPVLLMGGTGSTLCEYKNSIPDPQYPQYFEKLGDHVYRYRSSSNTYVDGNFCKVLQIKPGVAVVKQDIVLERRNVLGVVKIQDAEGQSLPGVAVWGPLNRIEGDACTVYGETTDKSRFLVFYEPKRKLAGTLKWKAGEKWPPVVKLKPTGSVTGRLLDADGKPLAGIVVAPRYRDSMANNMNSRVHETRPVASDANGAFTLDSLIPELPFELSFRRGRRDFAHQTKPADATVQIKPGACRDVGAIKLKPVPEKTGE